MIDQNDRQIITIDEACVRIGVSRRSVYNWMADGKVEYIEIPNGNKRIYVDSLYKHPKVKSNEI